MNAKTIVSIMGVAAVGVLLLLFVRRQPHETMEEAPPVSQPAAVRAVPKSAGSSSHGMAQQIEQLSEQRRAEREGWTGGSRGANEGETMRGGDARAAQPARHQGHARGDVVQPGAVSGAAADDAAEFEALKRTALTDNDTAKRLEALETLDSFDDQQVVPILTQALNDRDPEVRLAALQQLANYDEDVPFETFANAVYDSDPEIRAEALRILADTDDERAIGIARNALNDPDEDVRSEAEDIVEVASDG